ncbi:MAG: hypothetical protein ACOVKJ_09520 [Flavobacterium sp.]
MKHFPVLLFVFISLFSANNSLVYCQNSETAAVFKAVVSHYYKNEKPVYKNRGQLLYLYCTQAKPNEELVEAVKTANLPADFTQEIRAKINTTTPEKDWTYEWKQLPNKH